MTDDKTKSSLVLPQYWPNAKPHSPPHRHHVLAQHVDADGVEFEVCANMPQTVWWIRAAKYGWRISNTLRTFTASKAAKWVAAVKSGHVEVAGDHPGWIWHYHVVGRRCRDDVHGRFDAVDDKRGIRVIDVGVRRTAAYATTREEAVEIAKALADEWRPRSSLTRPSAPRRLGRSSSSRRR